MPSQTSNNALGHDHAVLGLTAVFLACCSSGSNLIDNRQCFFFVYFASQLFWSLLLSVKSKPDVEQASLESILKRSWKTLGPMTSGPTLPSLAKFIVIVCHQASSEFLSVIIYDVPLTHTCRQSLWVRNFQLGLFSALLGLGGVVANDFTKVIICPCRLGLK